MPSLEAGLYAYLPDGAVGDIVGNRIYPVRLPEGCILPAISWQRVSAQRTYTHDPFEETAAFVRVRIQFNCWDVTANGAMTLGEAVVEALSGLEGDMGGQVIGSATVELEMDDYEPDTKLYRRIVDVYITYEEGWTGS